MQTRIVICVQQSTEPIVDERFCNAASQPVNSRVFNNVVCSSRWKADSDWSTCSKSCGGGVKTRKLYVSCNS